MAVCSPVPTGFRGRLVAGDHLVGTFIKTPTCHGIEILGDVGYDFVVVDQEHAPFDRAAIDIAVLAARATGTAALMRVADPSAASLLSVLDCGATGVIVPHIVNAKGAREAVSHCRYRGGRRGFSNSPRAGRYGATALADHIEAQDREIAIIATIEDPEALDNIDAIVAVDGIDGLFIGRGDLAVALGATGIDAPAVRSAVERIMMAARKGNKPVCIMVNGAEDARPFKASGVTAFIVSTDQGFLRRAASQALGEMRTLKT